MMKNSSWLTAGIVTLLSTLSGDASGEGRDPFSPYLQHSCAAIALNEIPWRLTGVIGKSDHFIALLRTPQQRWGRFHPGVQLDPQWQLVQVKQHSATLRRTGCDERITVMLSGGRYAESIHYGVTTVAEH